MNVVSYQPKGRIGVKSSGAGLVKMARTTALALLWLLVGLILILLFVPVAVAPFITAVPPWLALALALTDMALLGVILVNPTPRAIWFLPMPPILAYSTGT